MAKAKDIVMAYQKALGKGDMAGARTYLHDDLSFVGPFESFQRPEPYLEALGKLHHIVERVEPRRALRPRCVDAIEEDQPSPRRGSEGLWRIHLPHLPGHPLLTGQEPVQDPCGDPFLARPGDDAGAHGSRLFPPPGIRRERRPLRGLASRPARPQEDPRPNRRGAGLLEESPALEDRTQRGILQATPARI